MAGIEVPGIGTIKINDEEEEEATINALPYVDQVLPPVEAADLPVPVINSESELLTDTTRQAVETTPAQEAFDLELAKTLGLDRQSITKDTRSKFDKQRIKQNMEEHTEDAPVTRGYLRLDQALANMAVGDEQNIRKGEIATRQLTFTGAFSHGVDLLQGLGWRFVETVGEAVGSEDLEAFAQAKAETEFAQAEAGGVKKKFLDIDTVGDFFQWLKQTGGEQIPLMAPSLAGGIAGGVIGSAVPIIGTVVGAALGAFIPSFILGVGETQNAIKERDKNVEAPGAAFGSGAIIGLLDSMLPGKIGTMVRKAFGREAGEKMLEKVAFKIMAKNAAAQGGKGAGLEGITEAIQEAISETTAATATGQEIDGQQLMEQMIEGFAAGFFLGGGVTTTTSVGTDIVKNRQVKRAMDESSRLEAEGKLKGLNAEKAAELKVAQMKASGVESVFVPMAALHEYAQTQEDPVQALDDLGVVAGEESIVELSLEAFTQHLHGTEGYKIVAPHLTVSRDTTSLAASVEEAFTDEEQIADYEAELEAYDASVALKERVAETVGKAKADPPNAWKIIEDAGREVEVVLDTLIQNVHEAREGATSVAEAEAIKQLDTDIAAADTEIVAAQDDLQARVDDGRATTTAEKKVARLIKARDKLVDKQDTITRKQRKAGLLDEFTDEDVAAPITLLAPVIRFKGKFFFGDDETFGHVDIREANNLDGKNLEKGFGYITSTGEFVDVNDAADIALNRGQINNPDTIRGVEADIKAGIETGIASDALSGLDIEKAQALLDSTDTRLEGTKVVGKDGKPLTVFHHGSFDRGQDGAIHFGTEEAARERAFGKPVDDTIAGLTFEQDKDSGQWFWRSDEGVESFDFNEEGFATKEAARADGEKFAQEQFENSDVEASDLGETTSAKLAIKNPKRVRDQGADWTAAIAQAKAEGHDGIVYINQFEDKGSTSYIVFDQSQVIIEGLELAEKFDPEDAQSSLAANQDNSDFVYHATNVDGAVGIAADGELVTHPPDFGTDQAVWPDGSEALRSYFSQSGATSSAFAPEEGPGVLLRIARTAAKFTKERGTGDIITEENISADKIEFLGKDGKWHKLVEPVKKDARAETIAKTSIQTKGATLQKLEVKITKEMVRATRRAFKAGLKAGRNLIKAQKAISTAINKLEGLTTKNKKTLVGMINNAETFAQLEARLRKVEFRTAEFVETNRRTQIKTALKNVLKNTRSKGKTKPRGRFTAEVQAFLDQARVVLRISNDPALTVVDKKTGRKKQKKRTIEAIEIELEQAMTVTAEDRNPDPETLFMRKLMAVSVDSDEFPISTTEMENVLIELSKIKDEGREASLARIQKFREKKNKQVAAQKEAVKRGRVPTKEMDTSSFFARLRAKGQDIRTSLASAHNGWDELLDIVFNTKGSDASVVWEPLRITKEIQLHKARLMKWQQQLQRMEMEAYGIEGLANLDEKQRNDTEVIDFGVIELAEPMEPKEGEVQAPREKRRLQYSRAELRKLWMEWQDPTLKQTIEHPQGMGFDERVRGILFNGDGVEGYGGLTAQDEAFAKAQLEMYREMYKPVNKVHRERFGVDLPFNEFYSPVQKDQGTSVEGGKDTFGDDLVFTTERTFRRSIPKEILSRTDNMIPLMIRSDIGAMHRYMHDMSWFIEASEKVQFIQSVMKDEKLKADIAAHHGNNMNDFINGFMEDFGAGYAARSNVAEKVMGNVNRLFAGSVLALKGTIGTKQLVSWFAMADGIPSGHFMASQTSFFKNGRAITKWLYENSIPVQERGSSLDFEMAKIGAINKPLFSGKALKIGGKRVTPNEAQWEHFKFALIKLGDRMPIYSGGWAVYTHNLNQLAGKKLKGFAAVKKYAEAHPGHHAKAMDAFNDAFSTTQQSTDIDKMSAVQRMGAIGRTLTMFMTARMALLRGELRAIRHFKRGKITAREFGKRMAYYHFIMPMTIQYIASGFEWEEDRQLVAGLLGQLNSFVIFGDVLMAAAEGVFVEDQGFPRAEELVLPTLMRDIWKGVTDAVESGGDMEELLEAMGDIASVIGTLTGQPIDQVQNIIGGMSDVIKGDIEKGMKRTWGFNEKVAEKSSR